MLNSCRAQKELLIFNNNLDSSDTSLTLSYKNISNDTLYLYLGGLKVFGYQNFNFKDKDIIYKGDFIQLGMPFGSISRSTEEKNFENCNTYVSKKIFKMILPNSIENFSFNLNEMNYSGFIKGKKYYLNVTYSVASEFEKYCLKIWTGQVVSEMFFIYGH